MKFRHFILPVLMLLAACSEPYPYPPQFASTVEVPPTVLPQPPQRGTDAYNAEIDSIIAQQHMLTEKQKAVIVAENKIGPGMIVTGTGAEQAGPFRLLPEPPESWLYGGPCHCAKL